ncbi:MAG: hypothetical protein JW862_09765 [Anaerolineales bacterium]|nr:hypothetical protein [Anaerolineales bacterium]
MPSEKVKAKYIPYTSHNIHKIPQFQNLPPEQQFAIQAVSQVLPFRTNNYVVDELIEWQNVPDDPIFILNFPLQGMLRPRHYEQIAAALKAPADPAKMLAVANQIRSELNPHPAGQLSHNVPRFEGQALHGMQHKYHETVLFFPSQGQTCHAYCTFCFRWPQFIGQAELKFAMREADILKRYIEAHPEVTDVLFTGGDPLIMRTKHLRSYIEPLLKIPHLKNIRIGSKALAYWPYRFTSDNDADDLLRLFEQVVASGKQLALMAHFNHPRELQTEALVEATRRVRATGAIIRTQSALLRHLNDDPQVWKEMWEAQVQLGMIPYYMFIARDTGAQHYFAVPLLRAQQIFREAYRQVSGLGRTVRGPSMSCHPGKVRIIGAPKINGKKVIALEMIQARDPKWVGRPFFARYNPEAIWIDDLEPAFDQEHFFFEPQLKEMNRPQREPKVPVAQVIQEPLATVG